MLSFEYAASPKNIEGLSKKMFDTADKDVRVGISRTDIDSLMADSYDQNQIPSAQQFWDFFIDKEDTIRRRYYSAKKKFEDRMKFTGPDCGLGGWPSQEAAQLLLERTVKAVKTA